MTNLPPAVVKTCYHLRHAPMGFGSSTPWQTVDDAPASSRSPCSLPSRAQPSRRAWWARIAVVGLLATYFALAWTASFSKGVSFDEGLQLAVGYNIWRNDDLRLEGANGDLVKRWATLPYLVTQPAFLTPRDPEWRTGTGYDLGFRFLFELGNRPESLLRQGRAMIALLGVATGLLVFFAARELFGVTGGLVALTLFAFSPSMLAFGGIVSTDMSVTFALFGATWLLWRLLHEVSWVRVALSTAFVALVVLAKMSGLVIIPIAAVLVALRLVAPRPLRVRWRKSAWLVTSRPRLVAVFGTLAALHVGAAWCAIWAHYGFRYAARPASEASAPAVSPVAYDEIPAPWQFALETIREGRLLPEGFCNGVELLLGDDDKLGSFMRGEWRIGGRLEFFPYAMWVKTPPALLVMLGLALGTWWYVRRETGRCSAAEEANSSNHPAPSLYHATPHVVLAVCYLAVAMTEDVNIGHRHVLPIYPALFVLAGAAVLVRRLRSRVTGFALSALLLWQASESFAVRPYYLSYFASHAGGPENGYKQLVDSSLDWGMNLPSLKRWLERNNPEQRERVYLAYFGNDNPEHYGIQCHMLPGFFDRREFKDYTLRAGYYAISATLLQGVYTAAFGPWNREYERLYQGAQRRVMQLRRYSTTPAGSVAMAKLSEEERVAIAKDVDLYDNLRFARLCAWLRHKGGAPKQVGHSILIWKLDRAALNAAIYGPPVELATRTDTVNVRRLRRPEISAQ